MMRFMFLIVSSMTSSFFEKYENYPLNMCFPLRHKNYTILIFPHLFHIIYELFYFSTESDN